MNCFNNKKKNKIKAVKDINKIWKTIIGCLITFAVTFVFFKTVILWGIVPSESMKPTLNISDVVVVNGLAYINKEPVRGDIVVFKGTDGDMAGKTIVKRIIGVPGDNIIFYEGNVYMNGKLYKEDYLPEQGITYKGTNNTVPEDAYFVMGDNRMNSEDSRYWNNPYLSKENIKGKVIAIIPISKLSFQEEP